MIDTDTRPEHALRLRLAGELHHLCRRIRARLYVGDDTEHLVVEARHASLRLGGMLLVAEIPEPRAVPVPGGGVRVLLFGAVLAAEDLLTLLEDERLYPTREIGETQRQADRRLGPAALAWRELHGHLRAVEEAMRGGAPELRVIEGGRGGRDERRAAK